MIYELLFDEFSNAVFCITPNRNTYWDYILAGIAKSDKLNHYNKDGWELVTCFAYLCIDDRRCGYRIRYIYVQSLYGCAQSCILGFVRDGGRSGLFCDHYKCGALLPKSWF